MAGRDVRQGWFANGLFTSWAEELAALFGDAPKAPKKVSKRAKRHMDEVGEILGSFCEDFHPARVEPNLQEMEALWDRCYGFKSAHMAAALVEQLSLQSGAEWQSRLRALCLLEQCFDENSKAPRLVAMKVYDEAEEVLEYLAKQVPQCSEKAQQVLQLCSTPPPIVTPILTVPAQKEADFKHLRPSPAYVYAAVKRKGKKGERQALLSDVGEMEPQKEETETTASSGDDDAKKLQKDAPFDPNLPQERTCTAKCDLDLQTGGAKDCPAANAPPL